MPECQVKPESKQSDKEENKECQGQAKATFQIRFFSVEYVPGRRASWLPQVSFRGSCESCVHFSSSLRGPDSVPQCPKLAQAFVSSFNAEGEEVQSADQMCPCHTGHPVDINFQLRLRAWMMQVRVFELRNICTLI
jgi:hypothetical protein